MNESVFSAAAALNKHLDRTTLRQRCVDRKIPFSVIDGYEELSIRLALDEAVSAAARATRAGSEVLQEELSLHRLSQRGSIAFGIVRASWLRMHDTLSLPRPHANDEELQRGMINEEQLLAIHARFGVGAMPVVGLSELWDESSALDPQQEYHHRQQQQQPQQRQNQRHQHHQHHQRLFGWLIAALDALAPKHAGLQVLQANVMAAKTACVPDVAVAVPWSLLVDGSAPAPPDEAPTGSVVDATGRNTSSSGSTGPGLKASPVVAASAAAGGGAVGGGNQVIFPSTSEANR